MRVFYGAMLNVLGLLLFVVYIVAIVSLAAGVTWLVVRLTPPKKPASPPTT
jgi:uncharacterized BrkB/YihY/UPF0761 family membrane protein